MPPGQDRAKRVGDVGEGRDAGAPAQQLHVAVEVDHAATVDRHDLEDGAGLFAQQLPRHDVGMVLEPRDQYLVAGTQPRAAVSLRHEVDRLGRAAHEHDLARRPRPQEAAHFLTRTLEQVGCLLRQRVHAAMHVGMMALGVVAFRLDHGPRALAGGAVVQVDQRLAVHAALQDREVGANALHVQRCDAARFGGHQTNSWIRSRSGNRPTTASSRCRRNVDGRTRRSTSSQKAKVSSPCAVARSSPRDSR
jgi:hypothetical protein